ncbi:hypothetical protein E0K83_03900 [Gramella sp. BOM4]|nr:hypothetical protein [Christiangramia bathymodioli]
MKKIVLILSILVCTACVAQNTEPEKKVFTPLTVITISGEDITFQATNGQFLEARQNVNAKRIPDNLVLEEDRVYRVKFRYLDCDNCPKRLIEILGFSIDPDQARKDGAEILKS